MKCDYISIRPLKPVGERIREAAANSGKSLQGFILDAVDRQISEDEDGTNIPAEVLARSMEWLKDHGHSESEIVYDLIYVSAFIGSELNGVRLRG